MDRVATVSSESDVKRRKLKGSSSKKRDKEKKEKHMSSGDAVSHIKMEKSLSRSTSLRVPSVSDGRARRKSSKSKDRHGVPRRSNTTIAGKEKDEVRERKRKRSAPAATDDAVRGNSDEEDEEIHAERTSSRKSRSSAAEEKTEKETAGELSEEIVTLIGTMQAKMDGLQEQLAAANADNAQLAEKVLTLNRDIRNVQGSLKTLSKQHADEVVDRFRQYDQAFSVSLRHLQVMVEDTLKATKAAVTETLQEVVEKHKSQMDDTLKANLEKVSQAGDEHVTSLKGEMATEIESLKARAKSAQEEYIAAIDSAKKEGNFVSEPSDVASSLVERLVREAVAAQLPAILKAAREADAETAEKVAVEAEGEGGSD